jgi:hypothetical protein
LPAGPSRAEQPQRQLGVLADAPFVPAADRLEGTSAEQPPGAAEDGAVVLVRLGWETAKKYAYESYSRRQWAGCCRSRAQIVRIDRVVGVHDPDHLGADPSPSARSRGLLRRRAIGFNGG